MCLLVMAFGCHGFLYDTTLPHHIPKDCTCAAWSSNSSTATLWSSATARSQSGASCAMPANALTPDLALPVYSPSDGWCLCEAGTHATSSAASWYTWCEPPATHPSQINLLVVNASAVAVNFITADNGLRSNCPVEAELRDAANGTSLHLGYSTLYRGARRLSYHHVTLGSLTERADYSYRIRVANRSAVPVPFKRTTGIKWCSGGSAGGNFDPGNAFGHGTDGICPILPAGLDKDQKVALCEQVCAAPNASACAGFTWYPGSDNTGICCFRTITASKPPDPAGTAECYEKSALPCGFTNQASEWSDWNAFRALYSTGETRLALYADMGIFVAEPACPAANYTPPTSLPHPSEANVGNLLDDLRARRIDWAIHSGDHAYEFKVNGLVS